MTMLNNRFILLIMLFVMTVARAETQLDLNNEACEALQKADNELNQVYQNILVKYKTDQVFIDKFVNAQRKWIEFKDAYVDSMYIPEYQDTYGSVLPMCKCYFIENITEARTKQLKVWIDGIEEGDVCTGSVNQ
ncbi:lysozyme inhibitor LprI family protein [Legionella bononiensis]|uniref:DUF1311 domain-containing protein n=1 Tax=Legionella bononiensis TaxID=2793102 RepID=A0ABS1WCA7_9GAMM|nr:lysozyme inhibitor LprI family protein [Legionella bononiensis]MBL7478872.1 DUF1311 domain-containing protein [Legionella bononiensis]MBL7527002.1 DUF1311 domain-containing protein [Legionella bononiensis]MBL7562404.1 DUF1311 domain-containing protein [Legionella bononiensis]